MDLEDALARDPDIVHTLVMAHGARNGVENLHAEGVFDNAQAPALNALLRQRIYQWLLANRYSSQSEQLQWLMIEPTIANDDVPWAYVTDGMDDLDPEPSRTALVVTGARAAGEFCDAIGVSGQAREQMMRAAGRGTGETFDLIGNSERIDEYALAIRSIPDYWETPELEPEFEALLPPDAR